MNELLRAPAAEAGEGSDGELAAELEDFEDFDPYDSTRLFWEQFKQLGFTFREIRKEDVTGEEIVELLKASEPMLAVLSRIQRRKEQSQMGHGWA